jgi:hypothetical protein
LIQRQSRNVWKQWNESAFKCTQTRENIRTISKHAIIRFYCLISWLVDIKICLAYFISKYFDVHMILKVDCTTEHNSIQFIYHFFQLFTLIIVIIFRYIFIFMYVKLKVARRPREVKAWLVLRGHLIVIQSKVGFCFFFVFKWSSYWIVNALIVFNQIFFQFSFERRSDIYWHFINTDSLRSKCKVRKWKHVIWVFSLTPLGNQFSVGTQPGGQWLANCSLHFFNRRIALCS